jgi:hypothetical protein
MSNSCSGYTDITQAEWFVDSIGNVVNFGFMPGKRGRTLPFEETGKWREFDETDPAHLRLFYDFIKGLYENYSAGFKSILIDCGSIRKQRASERQSRELTRKIRAEAKNGHRKNI